MRMQSVLTLIVLLMSVLMFNSEIRAQAQETTLFQPTGTAVGDARIAPVSNGENSIRTSVSRPQDETCEDKLATANRRLNTMLDEAESSDKAIKSLTDEREALKAVVKGQDERINGLLDAFKELAQAETKDQKKSVWQKIKKRVAELVDYVTDPKTLSSIATLIVLIKAVKN